MIPVCEDILFLPKGLLAVDSLQSHKIHILLHNNFNLSQQVQSLHQAIILFESNKELWSPLTMMIKSGM